MKDFNWKHYCYTHKLPSSYTQTEAYNHYLKYNSHIKQSEPTTAVVNNNIINNTHETFDNSLIHHKNLLFLCHTVPTPDIDSGSNRIIQILKIIIDLGYNVYYLTHDGQHDNPGYIQYLYDLGIKKVLIADREQNKYCHNYIEELTLKEKIIFSVIIFEFYEMYTAYWDKIQYLVPNVKVLVDSVDVHWIRKLSNPNNTPDDITKIQTEKLSEQQAYSNANVVFAVTEEDKDAILKECPGANVKILSNIHSVEAYNPISQINKKKDLIFVGGDNHTPNTIAAKNAIETFLVFLKQYPMFSESRLHIVGKRSDHDILRFKSHKNIIIHEQLPQSVLDDLYKQCYGAFCPITWGAGIKGKVCEAISKNLVVISTDIGTSGLNLIHNQDAFIANNTTDQILAISTLFNMDTDLYTKMILNAGKKLEYIAGVTAAHSVLNGTLNINPVTISIVTYNNQYLLQRCLESILSKTTYPQYNIHVTSNACIDDTPLIMDFYTQNYPHITYQYNVENKHFLQAHNETIDLFPNNDIILLNEDIEILSRCWVSDLYSAAYSAGYIGCAGGKTIYPNGTLCEAGAKLYNNGSGENMGRHKSPNDPAYNSSKYVGYVSGCMMYMRRDCINQFGKMDMRYHPCYYEDSDWQYNLHINGYKTIYTPKVVAIHREGSSCGTDIEDNTSFKRFMKINRKKFLDKYSDIDIEQYNT